jgi:hypothetical protein
MLVRLQQNQRVSLKFSRPTHQTLLLALGSFVILVLSLEAVARSKPVQAHVPFQAYGSNHIQFEVQIKKLKAFIAQKGLPDCLILGTSQSLRSIDPKAFAKTYKELTGKDILCYNFSVVGATLPTTYLLSKILVNQLHPKLLIVGTSFLDFTERRENRNDLRFEENTWIAYQLGKPTIKGWLLEHSYAYRLLTLISYGAPDGLKFANVANETRKWIGQIGDSGFGYSDEIYNLEEDMSPGFLKNFLDDFGKFRVSTRNLDSLEMIIEVAQQAKAQPIIVEMPYHPSLIDLRDSQGQPLPEKEKLEKFVLQVNTQIASIANLHQILFWTTHHLDIFPKNGWHDRYHLNGNSSPLFSRWLAQQVAAAVLDGQIDDPTSQK